MESEIFGLVEENLAVKLFLQIRNWSAGGCTLFISDDNDEAFMAGQAAVKAAIDGETDKMVILVVLKVKLIVETSLAAFRNC